MAVSIGCRVMHLDWLRAAWAARDSIQINVTTINFVCDLSPFPRFVQKLIEGIFRFCSS